MSKFTGKISKIRAKNQECLEFDIPIDDEEPMHIKLVVPSPYEMQPFLVRARYGLDEKNLSDSKSDDSQEYGNRLIRAVLDHMEGQFPKDEDGIQLKWSDLDFETYYGVIAKMGDLFRVQNKVNRKPKKAIKGKI